MIRRAYAYLHHLLTSDDPAPMWSAALACVSVSLGASIVVGLSALMNSL